MPVKNLADLHSQSIADMVKYLGISEKDVPSLVLTNLVSGRTHFLALSETDNIYKIIKEIIIGFEPLLSRQQELLEKNKFDKNIYTNYLKYLELIESLKGATLSMIEEKRVIDMIIEGDDYIRYKHMNFIRTDRKLREQLRKLKNWERHFFQPNKLNREVNSIALELKHFPDIMDRKMQDIIIGIEQKLENDLKKVERTGLLETVLKICEEFKNHVENGGGWKLCVDKSESDVQLYFKSIALAYCKLYNFDISPEVNNGNGSVDFKISYGFNEKVLIEFKLTSNNHWKHGYEVQSPIYMQQENSEHGIYVLYDNGHPRVVKSFFEFYEALLEENKIPYFIIDGTAKKSASVRKKS